MYKKITKCLLVLREKLFSNHSKELSRIDVLIPCTEKDYPVIVYAINYAKKNIMHKIDNIYIVAPKSFIDKYSLSFECNGIVFIEENSLGINKKIFEHYIVNNINRVGWLFQQFIKLSGDEICLNEKFLVLDADTIIVSRQSFEHNSRDVLLFSDEFHKEYYDVFKRIFGYSTYDNISCVTHHMLFEKKFLKSMKKEIEERFRCNWIEAIVSCCNFNDASCFSEYELYGHWILKKYRSMVVREYFYNKAIKYSQYSNLIDFLNSMNHKLKSVSMHSYL